MNKVKSFSALVLVVLLLMTGCTSDREVVDGLTAIVNGNLIDGTGTDSVNDAVLIIDQGIIIAVGAADEVDIPPGATIIDAQGGTILPGIIDARASDLLNRLEISDGRIIGSGLTIMERALKAGMTTVRATGWDWRTEPDVAELRSALDAHGNSIPTMVIVGPFITHLEGSSYLRYKDQTIAVTSVEEGVEAATNLIDAGVDQIGIIMALPPRSLSKELLPVLGLEHQLAIVKAAHEQDIRVISQATFPDEAMIAIEAGVDEIPSWPVINERLPDELIEALVENSIPILTGYSVGEVRPQQGDARRFIDAGGTLVFGTFAPNSHSLENFYSEMRSMSLIGELTAMEIIVSATKNAAEVLGLGEEIGTIEAGKMADVIVVNGNPLDDLTLFRDGVIIVIKNGEIVPLES